MNNQSILIAVFAATITLWIYLLKNRVFQSYKFQYEVFYGLFWVILSGGSLVLSGILSIVMPLKTIPIKSWEAGIIEVDGQKYYQWEKSGDSIKFIKTNSNKVLIEEWVKVPLISGLSTTVFVANENN